MSETNGKVIRLGATDDSRDLVPTLLELLEEAKAGKLTMLVGFGILRPNDDESSSNTKLVKAFITNPPDGTSMFALRGAAEFAHEAQIAWMRNA